jgi:hypothetical protein
MVIDVREGKGDARTFAAESTDYTDQGDDG